MGWTALVTRATGESTLYRAAQEVDSADATEVLLVRDEPMRIEVAEAEIASADQYPCSATARLWVRVVSDTGDLKSFRATVLGSAGRAGMSVLANYLRWHCRRAIVQFAEERPAADLVDGRDRDAACAMLAERLKPAIFAAGLTLVQPPQVEFESEAFRRARRQQQEVAAGQRVREALAEARRRHISQLETLLQQLQSLSEKSPSLDLAALIRTFAEPQRGQIYEALWTLSAGSQRTQWIVGVAGNDVLCFDPGFPDAPARSVRVEGAAGPLRSVRWHRPPAGESALLVGAARGVYELGVDDLKVRAVHLFDVPRGCELRGGVNAAVLSGGRLFGTHSEVGLICWDASVGAGAAFPLADLTRSAHNVRQVQLARDRLVFSVDETVVVVPAAELTLQNVLRLTGSIARITALHAVGGDVFAGNEIGDIWHWPLDGSGTGRCVLSGGGSAVEGVQRIDVGGVPYVVYAERGASALQCMALGDTFVCRYETRGFGVRRCAAAADLFVAIDDTRDRLICWRPGESREPSAILNVSAQFGHTLQDVCLVTSE